MDAGLAVVLACLLVFVVGHFLFRDWRDVSVTRASDRALVCAGPDAPPEVSELWLGESGLGPVRSGTSLGAYGRQTRDPVVGRDQVAGVRQRRLEDTQAGFARRRMTGRLRHGS